VLGSAFVLAPTDVKEKAPLKCLIFLWKLRQRGVRRLRPSEVTTSENSLRISGGGGDSWGKATFPPSQQRK